MNVQFRPAVREQTSMLVGLAGPSSSGKTYSALRLATGMAGDGDVMMIDTEGRRGLHYADQFRFKHYDLGSPFRPHRYLEALQAAKAAGAAVIIVDSQSHSHEGPGGLLEFHEEELQRMAGSDHAKRERVKFAAWIKPKQEQNLFVNAVLQLGVNVIFCFRAKKKMVLVKDPKTGKAVPVDIGWQPICSDRFEYEMTALLMLPPNGKGVPDLAHESTKLQDQHTAFVKPGQQLTEATGEELAAWARGGARAAKQEAVAASDASASPTPPETGVKENAQSAFFARESLKIPLQKTGDGGDDFQKFDNQMRKAIKAAPDAAAVERLQKDNAGTLARYADTMPAAYHRLLDALRQAPEDATADAEQGALV